MICSGNFRARNLFRLLACLSMALMTTACMKTFVCRSSCFDVQGKEDITKAVVRLEKSIAHDPQNPKNADAYRQLAVLHAHYKNPAPNYRRSLMMFEKCLTLDPEAWNDAEMLYLKGLVAAMDDADRNRMRLAHQVEQLTRNNNRLKKANTKMVAENQELQEAMEKLKLLELMMEEKRRSLK